MCDEFYVQIISTADSSALRLPSYQHQFRSHCGKAQSQLKLRLFLQLSTDIYLPGMRITALRIVKFLVFCSFCLITYYTNVRTGYGNPKFAVRNTLIDSIRIDTIDKDTHVAFALLDERRGNMGEPSVRLLTLTTIQMPTVFCKFPNDDKVIGSYYEFSENHVYEFSTYYISCAIPPNQDLSVDVEYIEVSTNITSGWHKIPISYRLPNVVEFENYANTYSVCVPKLFGDSFTPERLVEFVELNRLLGVDRITLYVDKNNISSQLNQIFHYYGKEGILEIRNLQLPFHDNMIFYHAQVLTVTDCLVRHAGQSKFVAFHDLDEFLVPLTTRLLPDYLNEILQGNVSSVRVKTSYFDLKDYKAPITMRNIQASSIPDDVLTKSVVRPEHVFEQGIHHTSRVIQDYMTVTSGADDQIRLFHFKKHQSDIENKHLVSTYGDELQQNFDYVVNLFNLQSS